MGTNPQSRDTASSAEPSEAASGRIGEQRWSWRDYAAALALFAATAAVVLWQNSRLAVLWDLSYILENAFRISLGGVPYRDFPLPYAPLTFLTQAALIKLTGRVFPSRALLRGDGWNSHGANLANLLNMLLGAVRPARTLALLLSAPVTVLGIYCVFPHPFYDCDCTFAILVCICFFRDWSAEEFPRCPLFFTGAALVVPLFVKQNTGAAFLGSAGLALAVLVTLTYGSGRPMQGLLWVIARSGRRTTRGALSNSVNRRSGELQALDNSVRRVPANASTGGHARRLSQSSIALVDGSVAGRYRSCLTEPKQPCAATAQSLAPSRGVSQGSVRWHGRSLALLSGLLVSSPFLWVLVSQFVEHEPSERAESLLALWPFLLIVSLICALLSAGFAVSMSSARGDALRISCRRDIALVLPFVVIGTVLGAFLSQQLWGSTYAIWPLLMLLSADAVTALVPLLEGRDWP